MRVCEEQVRGEEVLREESVLQTVSGLRGWVFRSLQWVWLSLLALGSRFGTSPGSPAPEKDKALQVAEALSFGGRYPPFDADVG